MKPPFNFGLRFFLRILLPGSILCLAILPAVKTLLLFHGINVEDAYLLPAMVVLLGWLCSLFDMQIYMFFEGRGWPEWPPFLRHLRTLLIRRETARMEKLLALTRSPDQLTRIEASTKLRRFFYFGMNRKFEVRYPTRLGNLINAFERYSERVYGFEASFVWFRIWLKLTKDRRDEIDDTQAMADSSLYLVAALWILSLSYMIYFILSLARLPLYIPGTTGYKPGTGGGIFLLATILSALAAFFLYRSSLHIHDKFGRLFTAVIDNYITDLSFPLIEKHVDQILNKKPITAEEEHLRNSVIMDLMLSSRVKQRSLTNDEIVSIADWNTYLQGKSITVKHDEVKINGQGVAVVSCSGQSKHTEHPTIYLQVYPDRMSTCPYCNLKFLA